MTTQGIFATRLQRTSRRFLLGMLVCFVVPPGALAIELGEFSAARLQGDGWIANGVKVKLEIVADGTLSGRLSATNIRMPELQLEVSDLTASCPQLQLSSASLECLDARVSLSGLPLDASRFRASVKLDFQSGDALLRLPALALAGGQVGVTLESGSGGWRSQIGATGVSLSGLKAASSAWLELPLPDGVDGKLDAQFQISGVKSIESAQGNARIYEVSGSNAAGTLASENLGAALELSIQSEGSGWLLDLELRETRGQVYALPVFVDFARNPLRSNIAVTAAGDGDWPVDFTISQSGIGEFTGALTLDPASATVRGLTISSGRAQLPGAYDVYLQPFLVGTTADSLETAGEMTLTARVADASLTDLQLRLEDLYLDDKRGRFALYGLQGDVNWQDRATGRSEISWEGGYLYKIGLGRANLDLDTGNSAIALVDATSIPVLDGQLNVARFQLTHSGASLRDLEFEADLKGIGLRALTRALGWPPFAGTLSGTIPRMRLADNAITVAGTMSAEVFDGLISIENLRVSEPFGVLPQVNADIRIRALDLAALSATFSFGNMEGRLDGDLENLRMLGFSPVGFDARLFTTPGDRSRHRISQQAIENIADLGGAGAAAILSRGLLRFFEDFAYDEIGWSCQLEDEVCSMNGVEPAPNGGFYIVKGKGLPRINVIGYRSRVSWPTLVEKLRNINASGVSRTP